MRRRDAEVRRKRRIGVAWVAALLCAGCVDSTTQGNVIPSDAWSLLDGGKVDGKAGDGGGAGADGDAALWLPDGASAEAGAIDAAGGAAGPKLVFANPKDDFGGSCDTSCALVMNQNAVRKVGVRYLVDGQPGPADTMIEFALADPAAGQLVILTPAVFSDDKGEAWAEIKSTSALGLASVRARVPDQPAAGELQFDFTIKTKAKGPMAITLHYAGSQLLTEFGAIQARLIKQVAGKPACADLDLGDTLPPAAWTSPNLTWNKPWALTFPSLASWVGKEAGADGTVHFTVIGVAWPASGGSAAKATAGGCLDTGAVVKLSDQGLVVGDDVVVEVKDLPPRLKGIYDLTSHVDLLSVLPDPVEIVFKTILDVVSDPIAGLLSLACKLGGNTLNSLCGYVFEDPKNPSIKDLTSIGDIVTKFLNAILLSYLPPQVKQGLATGADLNEILTNLEIGGTFEFKAEPDATGFLPAAKTKEVWATVTYKWTLGQTCDPKDPKCGKKTFNVEAFQSDAIVGQFDLWRDAILSQIKIGKHALAVKWGALINFIVQKQLLPAMTFEPKNPNAPVVDSYAKLIKTLMAGKQCLVKDTCCNEFAKQLASKQGLLKEDFLTSTCEVLITLGTAFLESQLNQLDGTTGDPTKGSGLLLSADKCPIFETNQDQRIDLIGGPLPKDQCHWDMTLTIGGKPNAIKGIFYATRQQ